MIDEGIMGDMTVLAPAVNVCELCGSTNFVLEGGYYFCQICQTQSQVSFVYFYPQWISGSIL